MKKTINSFVARAAMLLGILMLTIFAFPSKVWAQHQPVGDIVYCHVYPYAEGLISLMGWAYDPDNESTSINLRIEVYTDQDCQNLSKTQNITAIDGKITHNVPGLEGLTGNHGFDGYITDLTVGTTYWIKVFAIDATGDGEVKIGSTQEITVIQRVEYGLTVGGVEVTSLNRDDLFLDRIRGYRTGFPNREPTVSYDPVTHTLTLNEPDDENYDNPLTDCENAYIETGIENLTIAGSWHMQPSWASYFVDKFVIFSYTDCSLTFDGDFTFLAEGDIHREAMMHCLGDVTIKSNSRMTVSCENNAALWCPGTLTIENGVDYLEMQGKGNLVLVGALSLGDQLTITEPVGGKVIGTNICDAEGVPTEHAVIEDLNYALPTSLTVDNVTATMATLTWVAPKTTYHYSGYAYRFKKKEDANWSDEVITTENSVTLNGLSSNTDYEFRLRVLYASERRSYASKSFNTAIVLPYEMGFEDGLDRWKMVNCNHQEYYDNILRYNWTGIRTCAMHEGTCGFQFGSNYAEPQASQYLISPGLPSTTDLSVSFYYKNNSSPMSFRVGYSSTTDDIGAFTWGNVTTISNAQWTKYEGILPAGTKYMAIEWIYVSGDDHDKLYLDDIRLTATLTLADGNDNTTAVNNANGATTDVTLQGRTLYRNGDWNTLTLPFAVDDFTGTPLAGATAKELDGTTSNLTDDILTLNFTNVTSIEAGKPYIVKWQDGVNVTINSSADWNAFAESVSGGMSFAGKTVLLGADINVSTMVGTTEHPFSGTFEGAGHTLNVTISGGGDGAAPFRYINGATIRNVKTTGTVSGSNHSAGLVGIALGGTNSIHDCHVAATVSTSGSYVGGIVGNGTTSTTTISRCLFGGSISASNMGILYGWGEDGGTHTVENCLAIGSYSYGSIDLLLGNGTVTNCWKNTDFGSQGDNSTYIYMGGTHPLVSGYLGSQWTYENGDFVLRPTVSVVDEDIVNPVFKGVTIDANASTTVAFTGGTFTGTYSPLASTTGLLFDAHNPSNGACRAYFSIDAPNLSGFDGWYTDAALSTAVSTIPFDIDGVVKLYAKWAGCQQRVTTTFAKEGYSTYYDSQYDIVLPAGVKARIVTAKGDGQTLMYETIADGDQIAATTAIVPKATPVMLQTAASDATQSIEISLASPSAAAISATNLLYGSDTETTTTGDGLHYKLSYGTDELATTLGWYWGAANGAAFTSAAHKAWLVLPAGSSARLRLPDSDDGVVTGIVDIEHGTWNIEHSVDGWYSLDGRRLNGKPSAKGLYIHNGKIVVIK